MTSQRLVAAFQPALLSRPPSEMSAVDHVLASDTMIFMVENQDHFLIGMRGTGSGDSNKQATDETTNELGRSVMVHSSTGT